MSQIIAKKVGKILAERALDDIKLKNFPINSQNPYTEEVAVLDKNGRETGRTRKRKRPIPTTLSANDARILKKVRSRAYHLDMSLFNLCGFQIGWSSVIALIPVIGDFIDCFMALMVIHIADNVDGGLPNKLRAQMMFNILIDFGIGLVPILGDVADMLFRANTRNAWLLETYLVKKVEAERHGAVTDPDNGKALPAAPPRHPPPTYAPPPPVGSKKRSRLGRFLGFDSPNTSDEEMTVGVTHSAPPPAQRTG